MSGSWTTTLKTDRWIKPFFKQYRRALVLALVLGLATFVFAGALMFTSGYLISRAAEMPGNILMIHLPVIFVRVFGIGKPIFQYFERLTSHDWVLRMTSSLRLKLYASLEGDAVFFKRSRRTGDVLGLLAEDIGHIQNLYLRTVFPTIVAYLLYIVIVIGLGFFSLWFALAVLLVLGVIVFLVPLVSALANGARLMRRKAMKNELYSELTDNVLGVSDWIFSHRGDEYLKRYKATEQAMRALDESMERFARRRDLVASVLYATVAVMLLVWAGSLFGGAHGGAANWIAAFVLGFFPLIDECVVLVGNDKLMAEGGVDYHDCSLTGTILHVSLGGEYIGHIVIADVVKEDAAQAIADLHAAGVKRTVMLTGDRKEVAAAVAEQLGIDEYRAHLLPQDKVSEVEKLLAEATGKGKLAFVGDGINDAPVLTRADIGIAMGAMGSDAAIEAADIVLMDDRPTNIAKAIHVARKTMRIVRQNIVFALAVKFLVLILAAVGVANMWLAVFADVGVAVLAILNAMRAMNVKKG